MRNRISYSFDPHYRDLSQRYLYQWGRSDLPIYYGHLSDRFRSTDGIEGLLPFIQMPETPTWLMFDVLQCMHCGRCVAEGDTRLEGCLGCLCDVCPRRHSFHYYRAGPKETTRPVITQVAAMTIDDIYVAEFGSG